MSIQTSEPVKSLTDIWRELFENDPILKALKNGTMSWADVPDDHDDIIDDDDDNIPINPISSFQSTIIENDYIPSKSKSTKKVNFTENTQNTSIPPVIHGRKTLMAKNLPRDITVQQLRTIFDKYGPTKDIYIPKNMDKSSRYFGTIKGFAKIAFIKSDSAANAFTSEYGRISIGGKNVTLEFANEDR